MPSVVIGGFAHPIDVADFNNGNVTDDKTLKLIGKGGKSPCVSLLWLGSGTRGILGGRFCRVLILFFIGVSYIRDLELGRGLRSALRKPSIGREVEDALRFERSEA